MDQHTQFKRKATLLLLTGPLAGEKSETYVAGDTKGIDLSNMHFRFNTVQQDVESPNNCTIRVYNLSKDKVKQIRGEFSRVVLQAGYEGSFGVIFDGLIKQFRIGRESATDTYLDILAADGDLAYNFGMANMSLAAGSTAAERFQAVLEMWKTLGVNKDPATAQLFGGVLPRGKVLFGPLKNQMRILAGSQGATWNINNGQVSITPLDDYKPGEAVVLTSRTGLVGIPEATEEGVRCRSLLNPKIVCGAKIQLNNTIINQTVQRDPAAAPIAFNQYRGLQLLADVTTDGFYRVFVAEHTGDTRGQEWYTDIVGLAIDPSSNKVKPYG